MRSVLIEEQRARASVTALLTIAVSFTKLSLHVPDRVLSSLALLAEQDHERLRIAAERLRDRADRGRLLLLLCRPEFDGTSEELRRDRRVGQHVADGALGDSGARRARPLVLGAVLKGRRRVQRAMQRTQRRSSGEVTLQPCVAPKIRAMIALARVAIFTSESAASSRARASIRINSSAVFTPGTFDVKKSAGKFHGCRRSPLLIALERLQT